MKKIGFVILTWNSGKCIKNCLDSLCNLDPKQINFKAVIIDNHSEDNTNEIVEQYLSENDYYSISTICLDRNYGTTISRNKGIDLLLRDKNVEYICLLDSDTVVNTKAILELIYVLDNDSQIGIVGPRMHDYQNVYQHSGRCIPTLTEKFLKVVPTKKAKEISLALESNIPIEGAGTVKVGYLMSACWMMRRKIIDEVGMLDEKIFYAPEDVDYCISVQKKGYSINYCYDADIIHEWQRISRKKLISKHNWEHIKGLVYMFHKHKYLFDSDKIFAA